MEYLKKQWIRIIVSLIGAGILMELLWVATASNPNAERPPAITSGIIIFTVIFYFGITKAVNKK